MTPTNIERLRFKLTDNGNPSIMFVGVPDCSPVNLAFDLSLIAFYDFIFVSCLSCLEVCPNESLPKSDDRNMFKFAFEI